MALQFDVALRNARLDVIETHIGASPTLEFRSGAAPADCATADSGSLLATITCPADFLNAAATGAKTLNGTWQVNASAGGTIGHFRMKASGGAVKMQGSAGTSGTDMILDNNVVASGQQITITTFTLNEPNG